MNAFDASEAATAYLKPHVRFEDLRLGDRFRFPGFQEALVRVRGGYRKASGSPTFKTGKRTAVVVL